MGMGLTLNLISKTVKNCEKLDHTQTKCVIKQHFLFSEKVGEWQCFWTKIIERTDIWLLQKWWMANVIKSPYYAKVANLSINDLFRWF